MKIVNANVFDDAEITLVLTRREVAIIVASLGNNSTGDIEDQLHLSIRKRDVQVEDYWRDIGQRLERYLDETS